MNLQQSSFEYYGKTIPIPNVNDIILVNFSNFDMRYVLITKVLLGKGKNGTKYSGLDLVQKGYDTGCCSPAFLKTRDDFDFEKSKKQVSINPKDKRRIISIEITEF